MLEKGFNSFFYLQVKYVISQPSADGSQSQQQIFLDANSLQGLIQSGTITLDGSGNKVIVQYSVLCCLLCNRRIKQFTVLT